MTLCRREFLGTGATLAAVGAAGCLGGTSGPEVPTGTEAMGEVAQNSVDGIDVVGYRSSTDENSFTVEAGLKNVGDATVSRMLYYTPVVEVYDAAAERIHTSGSGGSEFEKPVEPGESWLVYRTFDFPDSDPDRVARYEISLFCSSGPDIEEAAYCDPK